MFAARINRRYFGESYLLSLVWRICVIILLSHHYNHGLQSLKQWKLLRDGFYDFVASVPWNLMPDQHSQCFGFDFLLPILPA
ncbi:hypothetical protein EYC84_002563 [Monilinia fructicola]|uniref:Uncharacterized protein n=1 Tax=Monilinia fructicola TaxID=38448 RepID=A0A5M9JNL7_MONFR|nr:hypothetical protein EYC84_002563 [Monilinia fructicola]